MEHVSIEALSFLEAAVNFHLQDSQAPSLALQGFDLAS